MSSEARAVNTERLAANEVFIEIDIDVMKTEYWILTVFGAFSLIVAMISAPIMFMRIIEESSVRGYLMLSGSMVMLLTAHFFLKAQYAIRKTAVKIERSAEDVTFTLFDGSLVKRELSAVINAPRLFALASNRGSPKSNWSYQLLKLSGETVCIRSDWLSQILGNTSR